MHGLDLEGLRAEVEKRIRPFLEEVLSGYALNTHSIHVYGSALTGDFDPAASDINSVFVLNEMDLKFLEVLAPMGKKFGRQKVAAPLIMTPRYIRDSADVFPIEFLNLKLIHKTVYGEDILSGIGLARGHMKLQCEREIKVKLIALRQGYIAAAGNTGEIIERFVGSITGYIPLMRSVLWLCGKVPPELYHDVVKALGAKTGVDYGIFEKLLEEKRTRRRLRIAELEGMFEHYYAATERLGRFVDEITV